MTGPIQSPKAKIGARLRRLEDRALLTGRGRFVDDIGLPGTLHAAFVRSPHAHARVTAIDTEDAAKLESVRAILTGADLARVMTATRLPIAFPEGQMPAEAMPRILPGDEVLHVGEAVAIVIAESRARAEDAVDLVDVDYAPLPPVVDPIAALSANAPVACAGDRDNLFKRFVTGYGDCDTAFATAAHVVRTDLVQHRGSAQPMEGRGTLARFDAGADLLTIWSSTQMSHELRDTVAHLLGLSEDSVRVIAPDVGGGFGAKYMVYPEDIAVAASAKILGATVKWVEDRREHFVSAIQERDQHWKLEIAVDADARILGIRGTLVHDQGAYAPHSINVPFNSSVSLPGAYVVPAYRLEVSLARTNLPPVIPVRGAGYPQGCFAMERLMDRVAQALGLDRAEVRERNLVRAEMMPYATPMKTRAGAAIVYDSGDYPACQDKGLAAIDYAGFAARRSAALAHGKRLGIGIAHAVKGTGRGPFESGLVRVMPDGRVSVYTGALAMGQGLKTALAQICADTLDVSPNAVDVVTGDTGFVSMGFGGFASRQTVTAGSSVLLATREVRAKAIKAAAGMLEAAEADIVITDGYAHIVGVPAQSGIPLGKIAKALRGLPGYAFPAGLGAGLENETHFRVDPLAFANAFHACEVEVDIDTGAVRIVRYVVVNDSGRLINPPIVEGQIQGGVAHGIGNALYERMRYDDQGQPMSTTLADYLLPTSTEVPDIEILMHESPSPHNPLGIKGVGEVGVIPVAAAIASAVEDALREFGARIDAVPIEPSRILEIVDAATTGAAA
ncbi:xanthine dehydrogenase family protein molybdopterin-binding subunit [Halotia wernerae UHCC 0503]|nr:xanthine dehydrogenase family protein molybdopterin-binding subunit [Halotia wernerae UHCC 0503]